MKTIRHTPAWVLVAAGLLAPPGLTAQQPGQSTGHMGGMMGTEEHMAGMMAIHAYAPAALVEKRAELALTPAQVTLLEGLAAEIKQGKEKAHAGHNAHHAALTELFKQPAPDAAKVSEHARTAMQAMADAHGAELAAFAKAKASLTNEQRKKVEAWVAEHGKHEGAGAKHDGH